MRLCPKRLTRDLVTELAEGRVRRNQTLPGARGHQPVRSGRPRSTTRPRDVVEPRQARLYSEKIQFRSRLGHLRQTRSRSHPDRNPRTLRAMGMSYTKEAG
jgi:hypothetical protein